MLQKLDSDVQAKIDDLEGFKFVLTAIRSITGMSVNAELTYRELQERCHTLREHNVPVRFLYRHVSSVKSHVGEMHSNRKRYLRDVEIIHHVMSLITVHFTPQ
jgi:hypothetical protein